MKRRIANKNQLIPAGCVVSWEQRLARSRRRKKTGTLDKRDNEREPGTVRAHMRKPVCAYLWCCWSPHWQGTAGPPWFHEDVRRWTRTDAALSSAGPSGERRQRDFFRQGVSSASVPSKIWLLSARQRWFRGGSGTEKSAIVPSKKKKERLSP